MEPGTTLPSPFRCWKISERSGILHSADWMSVGDEAMALERTEQPATDLLLADAERGEVKLSELWSEGPIVLYFHRHFG